MLRVTSIWFTHLIIANAPADHSFDPLLTMNILKVVKLAH